MFNNLRSHDNQKSRQLDVGVMLIINERNKTHYNHELTHCSVLLVVFLFVIVFVVVLLLLVFIVLVLTLVLVLVVVCFLGVELWVVLAAGVELLLLVVGQVVEVNVTVVLFKSA